ncbi:MAG: molybdopterin-dependent oxidoreductase [Ardenticatenia bacterium]|nr:molybdopterin-dependent oxidoreductase [Ardenticatenia bacterium]
MPAIAFELNGEARTVDVPYEMPLLWVLRDVLDKTGTKYGCGVGVCGSCVVLVNGRKEQSCQLTAERVEGAKVTTIEGLSLDGSHPLQRSWMSEDVPQCGYCQAGQLMQAAALLARKPQPTDADIDAVMVDNICRCGTYQRIRAAIHKAAAPAGFLDSDQAMGALTGALAAGALLGGGGQAGATSFAAGHDHGHDACSGSCDDCPNGSAEAKAQQVFAAAAEPRVLSRRSLIKGAAAFQLGLLLTRLDQKLPLLVKGAPLVPKAGDEPFQDSGQPMALSAWIGISTDDEVTLTVSKSEMGQGVRTSLAMLVAEELDADWSKVRVAQAPANQAAYGNQFTVGSTSVRGLYTPLRQAGAAARAMLVAAAAQTWGVDASACTTEPGAVLHAASGRRLRFGELAAKAAQLPVPAVDQLKLKDPAQFRLVGKDQLRVDNLDVVTGRAIYGLDVRRPGMKYAVLARPGIFGASITAFDAAAALKLPGVRDVRKVGANVAVLADNTWAALQGRDALKLTIDPGPAAGLDDAGVTAALVGTLKPHPELPGSGVAAAVEAQYDMPYLAHATMEPMNCFADVGADKALIIAPTQGPGSVQQAVARDLGLPQAQVEVQVTLMGGGFGRRAANDFAIEAAQLSKAFGVPVLLTWSRAEDMQNDLYRPASRHALRAGLGADGQVLAWQHHVAMALNGGGNASPAQTRPPYTMQGVAVDVSSTRLAVPTGFWRSVGHSQITFVGECFFDELAAAAGKDPFLWRQELLENDRLRAVLVKAAEAGGWGTPVAAGRARGIACVDGFGSLGAVVAEVSVSAEGRIRVHHLTMAVDVGPVINPLSARAQVEGGMADGVATALGATISVKGGRVQEQHFNDFKWLRIPDMPQMDIHFIEGSATPGGLGEVGYPATAPAIANAVFSLTGRRIRHLPMLPAELAGWGGAVEPTPTAGATTVPTTVPTAVPTQVPTAMPDRHELLVPLVSGGR